MEIWYGSKNNLIFFLRSYSRRQQLAQRSRAIKSITSEIAWIFLRFQFWSLQFFRLIYLSRVNSFLAHAKFKSHPTTVFYIRRKEEIRNLSLIYIAFFVRHSCCFTHNCRCLLALQSELSTRRRTERRDYMDDLWVGFNALVSFCRNAIYNISLHDLTEIADQVSTALI